MTSNLWALGEFGCSPLENATRREVSLARALEAATAHGRRYSAYSASSFGRRFNALEKAGARVRRIYFGVPRTIPHNVRIRLRSRSHLTGSWAIKVIQWAPTGQRALRCSSANLLADRMRSWARGYGFTLGDLLSPKTLWAGMRSCLHTSGFLGGGGKKQTKRGTISNIGSFSACPVPVPCVPAAGITRARTLRLRFTTAFSCAPITVLMIEAWTDKTRCGFLKWLLIAPHGFWWRWRVGPARTKAPDRSICLGAISKFSIRWTMMGVYRP